MNFHYVCFKRFVGAGNMSRGNSHNAAVTSCNFSKSTKKASIIIFFKFKNFSPYIDFHCVHSISGSFKGQT